jgi:dihydroxyacid dehydratase/phosphogluconate dehydratase
MTDGPFNGGSRLRGRPRAPETFGCGAIAVIQNGDAITIKVEQRTINLDSPAAGLKTRLNSPFLPCPLSRSFTP